MQKGTEAKLFKRAILLLPGRVNFDLLQIQYADWFADSFVIAVDKGIDKAAFFQEGVHLWVGDFDSSRDLIIDPALYGEKIPYPIDKDEIDTELAISYAMDAGATEILLLGGIGGRLDHQAALLFLPFQYPEVAFIHSNGEQTLTHLKEKCKYNIPTQCGGLISVIALTKLLGLTLTNVKWPLDDFTLELGRGLTYSNRSLSNQITVEIKKGNAWLYSVVPEIDESL